ALDPRVAAGCDAIALGDLTPQLDLQRELLDGRDLAPDRRRHRVAVAELALGLRQQLLVAQHHPPGAGAGDRVDARAHGPGVDPLEQRRIDATDDRRLVDGRGLLALDHLGLDQLAV